MQKISIKLNKDSLKDYKTSSYKNKDGVNIEQYELELVMQSVEEIITQELVKVIKSEDKWELLDIGFIAGKSVKLGDGKFSKEPIFGNATMFRDKKEASNTPTVEGKGIDMSEFGAAVDESQIPF